ncbi:MAG: metallophosphoesterase [Sphingomicrobium sp.]
MTHSAPRPEEGLALFHRIVRLAALLLALAALGRAATAAPAPPAPRIIAVGDLHGDYDAWLAIARAAGLVDPGGHWMGGRTILVQLGDVTDRAPDSLKIIRSLQQLQGEAPRAGGRVLVVLGNHEAMNVLGDLRYTTPGEFASYADARSPARRERLYGAIRQRLEAEARRTDPNIKPSEVRQQWLARTPLGWVEQRAAWAPTGELGRWARANPAVFKIGDTLFVHGGLSAEYAPLGIDEINRRAAAAMASADASPKSIISDALGPLWYRGLVTRDPKRDPDGAAAAQALGRPRPSIEDELTAVLAATGTRRMVIAHTPSLNGIAITNGGRLIRIDTGISRFYGGPLSWLDIAGDRIVPHTTGRTTP